MSSEFDLSAQLDEEERAARSSTYSPPWAKPLAGPIDLRRSAPVVEAPGGDLPEHFVWTPWGPMPRSALEAAALPGDPGL